MFLKKHISLWQGYTARRHLLATCCGLAALLPFAAQAREYPLLGNALSGGVQLRSAALTQGPGDMQAVGSSSAAHRRYGPEAGRWDKVQFYLGSAIRLNEGKPRLEVWVNIAPDKGTPARLRRVQLLVADSVGNRNYSPQEATYYIDGVKQPKGEFLEFDSNPNTWQKLELDLESGPQIAAADRIVRVAFEFTDPGDYYFGGLKLLTGDPATSNQAAAAPVADEALLGLERRTDKTQWKWMTGSDYRVMVAAEPFPGQGAHRPAWAALDFLEWTRQGLLPAPGWSPDTVRVIEYDAQTREPVRQREGAGIEAFLLESKVERWPMIPLPYDKAEKRRPIHVSWLRRADDSGTSVYGIYFDVRGKGETARLPEPAFLGTGDAIAYGTDEIPLSPARGFPVPIDWDGDGKLDLLGVVHTRPDRGTYLMLNAGTEEEPKLTNPYAIGASIIRTAPQVLDIDGDGKLDIACQGGYFSAAQENGLERWVHIGRNINFREVLPKHRAQNWHYADWDGDGVLDLIVAVCLWDEYGWDQGFDADGNWKGGALKGHFYFFKNIGTNQKFDLADPVLLLTTDGVPANTYGNPTAILYDWDGDGDLDLISADFLDGLYYFENVGTATAPQLAPPVPLAGPEGKLIAARQANTPVLTDWNGDGKMDLLLRDEAAHISVLINTGELKNGAPVFLPPQLLLAENNRLNVGQLPANSVYDWDGDGDLDLIYGESGGFLGWFENTGTPQRMQFAAARPMTTPDGEPIRIIGGESGSIQGPAEALWGYMVPFAGDWDLDGKPDVLFNSIWGLIQVARGTDKGDISTLAAPEDVLVQWPVGSGPKPAWNWWSPKGGQWATQWRGTVRMIDWTGDGLPDVVAMDHEGYLVLHERSRAEDGTLQLGPPQRIFLGKDDLLLRINTEPNGASGRMKFDFIDWDGDGDLDYVQVTPSFYDKRNVVLYENTGSNASPRFEERGDLGDTVLRSHTCAPSLADFDGDSLPDVLIGAEDGNFYAFSRIYIDAKERLRAKRLTQEQVPVQ